MRAYIYVQMNIYIIWIFLAVHSVHFERDDDGNIIEQPGDNDDMIGGYPDDDVDPMDVINDQQRRNLDQWCFAEHLDSSVFLQVSLTELI